MGYQFRALKTNQALVKGIGVKDVVQRKGMHTVQEKDISKSISSASLSANAKL